MDKRSGMTKAEDFGRLSQWRDTGALDPARARELASRLELRARAEDEVRTRDEYLGLLDLSPGERVLDVGCGSGAVTRAIARRVAPAGRVTGADASREFLDIASRLADEGGVGALVQWQQADCRALPFADQSFDVVLAATVLAHVPDAARAVAEMARVTRPGGRMAVFDFDGDSFLISHPDRELTRRIVAAFSDHASVNGTLVRRLPQLFARAGLVDIRSRGFMPLERGPGTFYASMAERAGQVALETGAIASEQLVRWLAELRAIYETGQFIAGRLHLFTWGSKPQSREA